MAERFTLHGRELEDGRIYITSKDMPGFRLLVQNSSEMEESIAAALRDFYPLYKAAEARKQAERQTPRFGKRTERRPEFDLSAEFAMA